jgi:hypothetical protein
MTRIALLSIPADFHAEIVKTLKSIDAEIYITSHMNDPQLNGVDVILWFHKEGEEDFYDYLHTLCPRIIYVMPCIRNINRKFRFVTDFSKARLVLALPPKPEDLDEEACAAIVTGALMRPRI